jgi:hypothetical protein
LTNKWLEPTAYKSNEEFMIAYNAMRGEALAFQKVIDLVEGAASRIEGIRKRMQTVGAYGLTAARL